VVTLFGAFFGAIVALGGNVGRARVRAAVGVDGVPVITLFHTRAHEAVAAPGILATRRARVGVDRVRVVALFAAALDAMAADRVLRERNVDPDERLRAIGSEQAFLEIEDRELAAGRIDAARLVVEIVDVDVGARGRDGAEKTHVGLADFVVDVGAAGTGPVRLDLVAALDALGDHAEILPEKAVFARVDASDETAHGVARRAVEALGIASAEEVVNRRVIEIEQRRQHRVGAVDHAGLEVFGIERPARQIRTRAGKPERGKVDAAAVAADDAERVFGLAQPLIHRGVAAAGQAVGVGRKRSQDDAGLALDARLEQPLDVAALA